MPCFCWETLGVDIQQQRPTPAGVKCTLQKVVQLKNDKKEKTQRCWASQQKSTEHLQNEPEQSRLTEADLLLCVEAVFLEAILGDVRALTFIMMWSTHSFPLFSATSVTVQRLSSKSCCLDFRWALKNKPVPSSRMSLKSCWKGWLILDDPVRNIHLALCEGDSWKRWKLAEFGKIILITKASCLPRSDGDSFME